jgi:hypothetical protein
MSDDYECQWLSEHFHDFDIDSDDDSEPEVTQEVCVQRVLVCPVRNVEEFLDSVLSDGEVCLLAKVRKGPKHWEEWLWLSDLEGKDLCRANQWILEQDSPPRVYESDSDSDSELGELTDHDDDDYDPDGQFESAYLRFREAFVGNKYQLRKMTFSKYLDLHGEAFKSAAAARLANSALPQHTLSEVQLAALRASNSPGFSVDHPAYLFFRAQPESFEKPADLAPSLSDRDG